MKNSKAIIALAGGLVLVSGAAWTMRPGADGIAAVQKGDVLRTIVAPGVVEPVSDQVALGFRIAGRIESVEVDEGARVEAGQVLARLDAREAHARVAQAEAAVEVARARLDATMRGARPEELRAAEAEALAARAGAWEREQWHARAEKLAGTRAVSPADLDGARGSAQAASAQAQAAEARLALLREGARAEVRREATAALAAARADLEAAQVMLSETELRAPRAGVILRRLAEPGEQVTITPLTTVLTMADLDHLRLRVEIDEDDVGRIKVGQTGHATADTFGARKFPGRVVRLTSELGRKTLRADDPHAKTDTRVLEVLFALDPTSDGAAVAGSDEPPPSAAALPLGLRMNVHIETLARRNVLTVPLGAVRRHEDRAEVVVLQGGEKVVRPVHTGADDGVVVEVADGLAEGELIAAHQDE